MVRNGFDGASSQIRSTPSGGGPVWSNSTWRRPQRPSSSHDHAGAEVRALRERDRLPRTRAGRAEALWPRPSRRQRGAPALRALLRARPASARPRPLSGARSASRCTRPARRRRMATRSSGRRSCGETTRRLGTQLLELPHPRQLGEDLDRGERDPDRGDAAGDDRRHGSDQRRDRSRLERAELVRGAR